jgi:ParB-like chromosome segregation protein Spo0J
MAEVLTLEEMKQRYNGEWLLIFCTEVDDAWNLIRGEVLAHSLDRDEVEKALATTTAKVTTIEYVGDIPEDWAVMF